MVLNVLKCVDSRTFTFLWYKKEPSLRHFFEKSICFSELYYFCSEKDARSCQVIPNGRRLSGKKH